MFAQLYRCIKKPERTATFDIVREFFIGELYVFCSKHPPASTGRVKDGIQCYTATRPEYSYFLDYPLDKLRKLISYSSYIPENCFIEAEKEERYKKSGHPVDAGPIDCTHRCDWTLWRQIARSVDFRAENRTRCRVDSRGGRIRRYAPGRVEQGFQTYYYLPDSSQ